MLHILIPKPVGLQKKIIIINLQTIILLHESQYQEKINSVQM